MKKKYLLAISLLSLFCSCQDEVLDKRPLDIISEDVVWEDKALVDALLVKLYDYVSVFNNDVGYGGDRGWATRNISEISCETRYGWEVENMHSFKTNGLTINGGLMEYWEHPYFAIRQTNDFIERLQKSTFDEDWKNLRIAEARFLRAFHYFAMVKRYGGVPLITKVLQLDDPEELLYPKRNSEKEIYDFILSELDEIEEPLKNTVDYGRITNWTVLAMKSRVALYAGSIAQFGKVQLDGLLGFPKEDAKHYYQISYDASKAIIEGGMFQLYNNDADKVTNFKNIFLTRKNCEVIFAKQYSWAEGLKGNGWTWDFMQCPKPHPWDCGMANTPYLEMAESFEYVDGRPGTLDREKIQNGVWSVEELWGGRDPRFYASIWTQETLWKGNSVDCHNGLLKPDQTIENDRTASFNGVMAGGNQHKDGDYATGFGIMKYLDESQYTDGIGKDGSDYIVFRYAEILLNYAEAAFELGKTSDALDAINQIRDRAGIVLLSTIDQEKIRHERKVELAFEGHRYWDVRRWRIATKELSGRYTGLRYILDYNSTLTDTKKYKIEFLTTIDGATTPLTFKEHFYYFPITLGRTTANPNLIENPGY